MLRKDFSSMQSISLQINKPLIMQVRVALILIMTMKIIPNLAQKRNRKKGETGERKSLKSLSRTVKIIFRTLMW